MSTEITNRVLALASWQEAGTLLLYYPLADEVDVRPLIKNAYDSGKKVLLPVVKGEELELRLYEGEASLKEGTFGIKEPTGPLFAPESYGLPSSQAWRSTRQAIASAVARATTTDCCPS